VTAIHVGVTELTMERPLVAARVLLDPIERAIAEVGGGRPVVVVDDDSVDSSGALVFAAQHATVESVAFAVRHTSGYLCVSLLDFDADRLDLPALSIVGDQPGAIAFTVTVDAYSGVSTGISAADRSYTIRLLADPGSRSADLSRPGHVVPVRARGGGVLDRLGHAEASLDLARLAGLTPSGVFAELVSRDNPVAMATGAELRRFADEFGLAVVSIADLVQFRRRTEPELERVVVARVPLGPGAFNAVGYASSRDGREHLAFVLGDVADRERVLVHVHNECLLGDVFGSQRCRCAQELAESMALIANAGRGAVVYLRGKEREDRPGFGLLAKLRAYQDDACQGRDTFRSAAADMSIAAPDLRSAAEIVDDLGIRSVTLLTGDPSDRGRLARWGVRVRNTQPLQG
jgi:3,4-dihydroxy 2-butanone 4-phosphate synthase/GTP cyclohydrolase II